MDTAMTDESHLDIECPGCHKKVRLTVHAPRSLIRPGPKKSSIDVRSHRHFLKAINDWCANKYEVELGDVMTHALGIRQKSHWTSRRGQEAAACLRACGYEPTVVKVVG